MPVSPLPRNPRHSLRQKDATPNKSNAANGKQTAMKGADFGKAIGIDKPANVRSKIAKWQADLAAEDSGVENVVASATEDDVTAAPSPKPQSTPKARLLGEKPSPNPAHTPSKSTEALPELPKSAKKPPGHNKLDDDVRLASAPKKRVVSDSHWRTQKSPPKDAANRPSPRPLPTAWVRPALKRAEPSSESKETKTSTPSRPELKPKIIFTSKSTGQRTRMQNQRRRSQPSSTGNDERPTSSGSGSAKGVKAENDGPVAPSSPPLNDKFETVRIRRRRRANTSPRGSLSAEDNTPIRRRTRRRSGTSSRDESADELRIESKPSGLDAHHDDGIRERRKSVHRRDHSSTSLDEKPKDSVSTGRQRSHRKSHQYEPQEEISALPPEPTVLETPPKSFGSRLEAWLQTTPDPFVDHDTRTRRSSKETTSTLEPSRKSDKSEPTASTVTKDTSVDDVEERKSSSRRRTRTRGASIKVDMQEPGDKAFAATPDGSTNVPKTAKDDDTPTQTLKRRGAQRAQRSPTKERAASLPIEPTSNDGDVASSVPSSSIDASAVELEKVSLRPRPDTLAIRRMFPSTGKRLSTIASVETFTTKLQSPPSEVEGPEVVGSILEVSGPSKAAQDAPTSEVGKQLNADNLTTLSRRSTKRTRLASHADLMSVLSMPRAGTKSIISARSIRTNRSRLATATIDEIMSELSSDETKYMRELRTLVDGVIPVLLSCVLSKSDSAVAAGLFSRSASKTDPSSITKPIIDMGIALERMKSLHRRIPKDNPLAFLSWAQTAQKVYSDYIDVWRLGFQDVVVNLAPADEDPFTPAKIVNGPDDAAPWDEGLSRNAEGYVVNGDGERVDVAYMLKRPLVRLKYLAKTLKGINQKSPSDQAEKVSNTFQDLVVAARKRSNEERARLEDEAAASIDPTRARDPRSLAPLAGVRIDPARCVRARDHFDMHLYHSSGQEVSCRVELLLRDDQPRIGSGGDLLFCEVTDSGRWLLLPPVQQSRVSARNGDLQGEIIVMIRGYHSDSSEWSEVMSLNVDDEQVGFEWVQMLGLQPIPPQLSELNRDPNILNKTPRPTSSHASSSLLSAATGSTPPQKSRTPSPHEIEIPIGEQAGSASKVWAYDTPERRSKSPQISPITPPSSDNSILKRQSSPSPISPPSPFEALSQAEDGVQNTPPRPASQYGNDQQEQTPRSLNEAIMMAGNGSPISLKRTRAKRLSKNPPSPTTTRPSRQITLDDPEPPEDNKTRKKLTKRNRSGQPNPSASSSLSQPSKGFSVWMPSSDVECSDESDEDAQPVARVHESSKRPEVQRRTSSVPSMDMPTIPKIRKTSQPTTPVKQVEIVDTEELPAFDPAKKDIKAQDDDDMPPPVPPHRSPSPASPITLKGSHTPVFTPSLPAFKTKRRSSSPLKHEYEPSTATESSSESEEEPSADEDISLTSESSEDELEDDVPTPLMPVGQSTRFPKVSPPASIYTLPNGTITPSQSASNTPYRAVPQGSGVASKSVASIFSWLDSGRWDSLHPSECSIVVTPGKLEVYELSAAHSKPLLADGDEIIQPGGKRPLIAVELTPLVPLRKSTAIDITIRSPPTPESRIKSGNHIMLRSRNPSECSELYAMINHSRINNPTYIALQNARGPYGQTSWAEIMDRQNAARSNTGSSGGWFAGTLGRRSSYRKTSTRAASISAATESSVGTMNTALRSALGRFSFGKNGRFNIRSSTLGSRSNNSFDTGSSGSGTSTPPNFEPGRAQGAPAGITNTKCRLYERDSFSSRWRDMGSARLTIMLPDASKRLSTIREGKGSPGTRDPMQEKRIVVLGKTKGETLLDVTLGESCFERVARSGIAVSVWEDVFGSTGVAGTVPAVGGVSGARARVFMIQMKSEREAAYSFSLLGKLRY
ncbi:hypothetical protein CC78DRAFT_607206 [Lojkania enalia]|uniref:Uncharacterized protein n=1 Tax=Lojkania enalia TaxID=147567 RepID=A0A9P4N7D2_9PLEO|nr:hypothetical protein CC78DRAFT_607206 [Didymosphaeria enalia]